jgi:Rap1a immunity proteins
LVIKERFSGRSGIVSAPSFQWTTLVMRFAILAAAAVLTTTAYAVPPDQYRIRTAGELVNVCGAQPSDADYATAIAFCHGVLAGAYGYFEASTPAADRFICAPNPSPTRTKVANDFVAWAKGRPQVMQDGAIDTLFRYAAEAYPCRK